MNSKRDIRENNEGESENKMGKSLQSEFVKYYKEKLEPLGFKKVKGRQPYFVRVVNDEILHIFTFMGIMSRIQGYKAFDLLCGVATVYRKEINFSVTPKHNSDWLRPLLAIKEKKDTEYPVINLPRDLMEYYYNDENISEVIEETYHGAEIIISELDKITDMDEALKYFLKHDPNNVSFMSLLKDDFCDEEGLYYARKEFDYTKIEKVFEDKRVQLKNSSWSDAKKKERHEEIIAWEERVKERRKKFLSNEIDYQQGMKLLQEHYNTNVDKLIGYGLDIQKKN